MDIFLPYTIENSRGEKLTFLRIGVKNGVEYLQVDKNVSRPPLYYMINCAHPNHFSQVLQTGKKEEWTNRIRGLRANASRKSHAELDDSTELDRGNPEEWGQEHKKLKAALTQLNVFGGCCGTDEEHVLSMARQLKTG